MEEMVLMLDSSLQYVNHESEETKQPRPVGGQTAISV